VIRHFFSSAFASIGRAPFTTAANILTLALGLACFIAAFGIATYWRSADGYHEKANRTYVIGQGFKEPGTEAKGVAREDDDWSVGMRCPCGCGQRLELMLLKQVKPRWDLTIDRKGRPTLCPSVWLRTGCRSHFWVRAGKIIWCE
jgi:hypothetical protein